VVLWREKEKTRAYDESTTKRKRQEKVDINLQETDIKT
jgi:hypothetical protein